MRTKTRRRFAGKARQTFGAIYRHVLREESRLAAVTQRSAWRVRGAPVESLRRLFAEQGRQIERWLGDLGERARAFGVPVRSARPRRGSAAAPSGISPAAAIGELLARHEAIAGDLRVTVESLQQRDPNGDTTYLLDGLLEFHEMSAGMLRLILGGPAAPALG